MWRVLLVVLEVVFLVLPVCWALVRLFIARVIWPAEFREIMRTTARLEMENYGYIVSTSVEWWLKYNDVPVCNVHPGLITGGGSVRQGGILICECPPNAAEVRNYYYRVRYQEKPLPASVTVKPPNPSMGVAKECLRKCRHFEEVRGDDKVLYLYCPTHGTRRDPYPPPPPPPIGGLIMPTRPNPTRGERR